jgi:hypothetical protein
MLVLLIMRVHSSFDGGGDEVPAGKSCQLKGQGGLHNRKDVGKHNHAAVLFSGRFKVGHGGLPTRSRRLGVLGKTLQESGLQTDPKIMTESLSILCGRVRLPQRGPLEGRLLYLISVQHTASHYWRFFE